MEEIERRVILPKKTLEKPTKILGLTMQELGITLAVLFTVMMISNLLRGLLQVSSWVNLLAVAVIVGQISLVRYASKKKYPSFILTMLAYYLMRPGITQYKKLQLLKKPSTL